MNQLKTNYNGGFPLHLNDIRFVDDAVRLAFKDLLKGIAGDTPVIIFGCTATPIQPEGHLIGEGAIFYQGEIWHVDEHTIGEYDEVPYWAFYTGFDPDGNKIFKDGLQHNTYEIRKAMQYGLSGAPSGTLYSLVASSVKEMKNIFLGISWANPLLLNETIIIPGGALLIGKSINGVTLQGQIRFFVSGTQEVLSVPVGYYPVSPITGIIPCKLTGGSDYYDLRFRLTTDGKLTFYSGSSVGVDVELAITYLTT